MEENMRQNHTAGLTDAKIFLTVGSQKFPFDRLLLQADRLAGKGLFGKEAFAQIGNTDFTPYHIPYAKFLDREEFLTRMHDCDVLVTHAGTGAIISGLKAGKKVVVVPRYARFGEHVDDHQEQIAQEFAEAGYVVSCTDIALLDEAIRKALAMEQKPFVSNAEEFRSKLSNYITSTWRIA